MTTTEKIAGAYLRLNGFLLLSHFTVLDGEHHGHVDYVGLRAANSAETVNEIEFPLDIEFFELISTKFKLQKSDFIGVVAEVKTDKEQAMPREARVAYAGRFLGNLDPLRVSFSDSRGLAFDYQRRSISVGLEHAFGWILQRVHAMEHTIPVMKLMKTGSWALSEQFLSDVLVLRKLGFLKERREDGQQR